MATFRRRSGRVNVLVRKGDQQYSKTFDTKAEAEAWAKSLEGELKGTKKPAPRGPMTAKQVKTFAMVMQQYKEQVTPTKSQARDEEALINQLLSEQFSEVSLRALTMDDVTSFRDKRLFEEGI